MNLLSEFKRRNVHRMAALYLAAAWLVMQVIDVVEGKLPLPDWLGSTVLAVLAVGFPIALIISWFYEVTPEGISRDTDEEPAESATGFTGRRVDFVIIAVLAAALVVFAYDKWWIGPPPERSVAVLPFVNMSADGESDYLGAGVADTILNMLVKIPDLHVASRTSSFQPRLQGLSIPEIAALLGVATVLEGSVQRQGDRLRITAQLINAEGDNHLWSENFDRDYSDIFAIQDEIAQAAASAFEIVVGEETRQRIDREGTGNLEAYTELMNGMALLRHKTTASVQQAVRHVQRAIDLDPNYALAHAILGHVYLDGRYGAWSELGEEEVKRRTREQAKTALRIAPGMSTALTLLGHVTEDRDAKGELYREAVENGPNDALALRAYANYLFFKRRIAESAEFTQKLISLDPLDEDNYTTLAMRQAWQKKNHAALETVRRGKEKIPGSVDIRDWESLVYFSFGNYRSAIAAEKETLELDPQEYRNRFEIGLLYLLVEMPDEAERWIESAAATAPQDDFTRRVKPMLMNMYYQRNDQEVFAALKPLLSEGLLSPYFPRAWPLYIEYGARLGKLDEVLDTFEERYPHLFAGALVHLNNGFTGSFETGIALLRYGDAQRGEPLIRASLEEADKFERTFFVDITSVQARLALGETDAALKQFRQLDATDKWINASVVGQFMLRYSSLYDPIRDEPEFIELLELYETNAAEQRRLLQEMDEAT